MQLWLPAPRAVRAWDRAKLRAKRLCRAHGLRRFERDHNLRVRAGGEPRESVQLQNCEQLGVWVAVVDCPMVFLLDRMGLVCLAGTDLIPARRVW
jgi:hypothetical protein